jgi:hypothetical protein
MIRLGDMPVVARDVRGHPGTRKVTFQLKAARKRN